MNDDLILIKRSLDGNPEAFGELMNRHLSLVYNTAFSITGNRADADDAAQETFIKAYNSLDGFREKSSFRTWLYRIAVNTCYDIIRKNGVRNTVPLETVSQREAAKSGEEGGAYARGLLNCLSPADRAIITLKDIDGFSYKEISKTLKCSLASVRVRLHRARKELIRRHDENKN